MSVPVPINGNHGAEAPIIKEFKLEDNGKSALMKVEWGGRALTIKQQYKFQKSEEEARSALEKTINKMLALADVYEIGKPKSKTKSITVAGMKMTQRLENGQVKTRDKFQEYLQEKLQRKSAHLSKGAEDETLMQQVKNIQKALELFNKSLTMLPVTVEGTSHASVPSAIIPGLPAVLKDLEDNAAKGEFLEDPSNFLKSKPTGTFIIQRSKLHEGCYTLYAHQAYNPRAPGLNLFHRVLEPTPNGIILQEQPQPGRVFSNVDEVLKFLKLDPAKRILDTKNWKATMPKTSPDSGQPKKQLIGSKPPKSAALTASLSNKPLGKEGLAQVATKLGPPPSPPPKNLGASWKAAKAPAAPPLHEGLKTTVVGVSKLSHSAELNIESLLDALDDGKTASNVSKAPSSQHASVASEVQNAAQVFDEIIAAIKKFKTELPKNQEQNAAAIAEALQRLVAATDILNNNELVSLKDKLTGMRKELKEDSTDLIKLEKFKQIEVLEDAHNFLEGLEKKRSSIIELGGDLNNLRSTLANMAKELDNECQIMSHPLFKEQIAKSDQALWDNFASKYRAFANDVEQLSKKIVFYNKDLDFSNQMTNLDFDNLEDSFRLAMIALQKDFVKISKGMENILQDTREIAEVLENRQAEIRKTSEAINIKDVSSGGDFPQYLNPIQRLIQIPTRMGLFVNNFEKYTRHLDSLRDDALATKAVCNPLLDRLNRVKSIIDLEQIIDLGKQAAALKEKKGVASMLTSDKKAKELEAKIFHLIGELGPVQEPENQSNKGIYRTQLELLYKALSINEKIRYQRYLKLLGEIEENPNDANLRKELDKHIKQMEFATTDPHITLEKRDEIISLIKQGTYVDVPKEYIELFSEMKQRYTDSRHEYVMALGTPGKHKGSFVLSEIGNVVDKHIEAMEKALKGFSKKKHAKSLAEFTSFIANAKAQKEKFLSQK